MMNWTSHAELWPTSAERFASIEEWMAELESAEPDWERIVKCAYFWAH